MGKEPYNKDTGSLIRWKPDLNVFTDIDIPTEYYLDTVKRQAVIKCRNHFHFKMNCQGYLKQQFFAMKTEFTTMLMSFLVMMR